MIKSIFISSAIFGLTALAAISPSQKKQAESKKTDYYLPDGIVDGGDRAVTDFVVQGIRHSINKDFERVVVDLEGTANGEPLALQRAPYFQVAVNQELERIEITLYGIPRLAFNGTEIVQGFRKSKLFKKVELLPIVLKDRWIFVLYLKSPRPVEVFELANNTRLILDIKK